jgi:REP element-mobilizing transposase RayT
MARKPRIHYPGALYHVILRGNARQDIFFDDEDRYRFYLLIQQGVERFGHRVHAFCLMTNHIHLAIQVADVPLSRIMQNLSFRYTHWINWRQNRNGHLFQGRYKAILVDHDAYLVQLAGYLHLNPLRVGMIKGPEDYPWSSCRAYLGMESIPWLTTAPVLAQFSNSLPAARRLFAGFVQASGAEGRRQEFHRGSGKDGRVLGEDHFVEEVLRQAENQPLKKPSVEEILEHVASFYQLSVDELAAPGQDRRKSEARSLAAWAVREWSDGTLTDLSNRTGRDVTTLSSAAGRLLARSRSDVGLAKRIDQLQKALGKVAILQA